MNEASTSKNKPSQQATTPPSTPIKPETKDSDSGKDTYNSSTSSGTKEGRKRYLKTQKSPTIQYLDNYNDKFTLFEIQANELVK